MIGAREDYVVDMLFQLARISAEDGDVEASDLIKVVWEALRRRAANPLSKAARRIG